VNGACKAGARLNVEESCYSYCALSGYGGGVGEHASEVDMVVTLGYGWEDGVDATLMQYCEGSILGPTTVVKSCFIRRCGDKNERFRPAHSDRVLPIVRAAGGLPRKLWEAR
jgi:hypothetical protein